MFEILPPLIGALSSIAVALITVWLKHYLDSLKDEKKRKTEECLSGQDVESMMEIQDYLEQIMGEWEFDRAAIFQFHNGGKFFNGVSMKKYSQTFEVLGPGIAAVKRDHQNVLVTQHPSLMKHISEFDFFSVDAKDPVLDYMRDRVEKEGLLQILTVPMKNLSGSAIGFIQFFTIKKRVKVTEAMKESLIEAGAKITGYLHN